MNTGIGSLFEVSFDPFTRLVCSNDGIKTQLLFKVGYNCEFQRQILSLSVLSSKLPSNMTNKRKIEIQESETRPLHLRRFAMNDSGSIYLNIIRASFWLLNPSK